MFTFENIFYCSIVSIVKPLLLSMSFVVSSKDPCILKHFHSSSPSSPMSYSSVLLLFIIRFFSSSRRGSVLVIWFIFDFSNRTKFISSAYLGSISKLCLSFDISQSNVDHSILCLWSSAHLCFVIPVSALAK